jgi:arginine exporter protein ArgO
MVTDVASSGPGAALVVGMVAGLGVAVPVGAVAVLLLEEALTRGRAAGLAAAAGVASVDGAYALLAVTAGAAATEVLEGREPVARWSAAALLALVSVRGILRERRAAAGPGSELLGASVHVPRAERSRRDSPAAWRVGARFVAVTAVNPATALYFGVVVAGWGARLGSVHERALFVLGVLVASAGWQVLLALAGAAAGTRLPGGARRVTALAGNGLVLALACVLAASA